MDEIMGLLVEIRDLLIVMNEQLQSMQGMGAYSSISDVCDKLDEIQGDGLHNNISDICDKLDEIQGDGLFNNISDVCDKLDSLDTTITLK